VINQLYGRCSGRNLYILRSIFGNQATDITKRTLQERKAALVLCWFIFIVAIFTDLKTRIFIEIQYCSVLHNDLHRAIGAGFDDVAFTDGIA